MTDLSSEYANPRKRPKLEPDLDTDGIDVDEKPFVNHPTLYFDDGNVILTTGLTLFCVHRSLLSKHSPVFRELFEREHDSFRDRMQIPMEETPEDLEALLGVIYDGLRLDVEQLDVETFPTLATLLRMSKRYQIERPCQDIVARIRAEWPAVLEQHDAKETKLKTSRAKDFGDLVGDVKPPQNTVDNPMNVQHIQWFHYIRPQLDHGLYAARYRPQPGAHLGMHLGGRVYPAAGAGNLVKGRGGEGVGHAPGAHHVPYAIPGPSNTPAHANAHANAPLPAHAPPPGPPPPPAVGGGNLDEEEDLIVHPASVLGLLRECGYADAQLLFPLFYALSRTTWQFGGPALGHHLAPLSAADMERLVVGIERMREHHTAFAITVPTLDPAPHQPAPGTGPPLAMAEPQCSEGIRQLWQACASALLVPLAGRGLAREPLEDLAALAPAVSAQAGRSRVCAACGRALAAKIEAFRRELWEKLPQFFELA